MIATWPGWVAFVLALSWVAVVHGTGYPDLQEPPLGPTWVLPAVGAAALLAVLEVAWALARPGCRSAPSPRAEPVPYGQSSGCLVGAVMMLTLLGTALAVGLTASRSGLRWVPLSTAAVCTVTLGVLGTAKALRARG